MAQDLAKNLQKEIDRKNQTPVRLCLIHALCVAGIILLLFLELEKEAFTMGAIVLISIAVAAIYWGMGRLNKVAKLHEQLHRGN